MIKKILLSLLVVIAAILLYATTQPDAFAIERRITIAAPPERVYANIEDFRNWQAWSPWAQLDTAMVLTLSTPPNGTGATYEWSGNASVGSGRMEITEAAPPSRVTIKLDFMAPMEAHNTTVFTLSPSGAGTEVVWSMSGPSNYLSKLMTTFVSMDKMVGGDFERGLQQLKAVSER